MPKPATTTLQNWLSGWSSSTPAMMADLYTFTLETGEVIRVTGFQSSVAAPAPDTDSPLFLFNSGPGYPRFSRTKTLTQIGPHIDELEISILGSTDALLEFGAGGTLTWQEGFYYKLFDGATVELDRAFIQIVATQPPQLSVIGTVLWFLGRVADVEFGRSKILLRVKSLLDLLTVQMPTRLFQASCSHVFGQTMCGFNRTTGVSALGTSTGFGQQTITCQAGSNQNAINTTYSPSVSTAYDNGTIIGGGVGLNGGFKRTISRLSGGVISFLRPWIFPVVPGTDTFLLLPGCDHTLSTCVNTFKNQTTSGTGRYGGMPYVPPPETAV